MMRRVILLTWVTGLVILVAVNSAGAVGLEFAFGGWMQSPSGTLGYLPSSESDMLDLENDLKYDDEIQPYARVAVDMPLLIPNIYLMATPMEFKADTSTDKGFKFGNSTVKPGTFYSELDWRNIDIGLFYGFSFLETKHSHMFNIDFGLNLRLIDYDLEIHQPQSRVKEEKSGLIPLPLAFLAVQFRPWERLSLEVEGRGISYSDNEILSLIGRVEVKIAGPIFIAGGYRYEKSKVDEDDIRADMEFSGPFLEVGLSLNVD